jgi:hypothetical protein
MVGSPGHQLADRDHQQWSPHNAQIRAAGAERGIDAATAPNGGYVRAHRSTLGYDRGRVRFCWQDPRPDERQSGAEAACARDDHQTALRWIARSAAYPDVHSERGVA